MTEIARSRPYAKTGDTMQKAHSFDCHIRDTLISLGFVARTEADRVPPRH